MGRALRAPQRKCDRPKNLELFLVNFQNLAVVVVLVVVVVFVVIVVVFCYFVVVFRFAFIW